MMVMGVNTMPCALVNFSTPDLIQELIQKRGAELIVLGPLNATDARFYYPIPDDRAEDDEWLIERMQAIIKFLEDMAELFTRANGPTCKDCGWYGYKYQAGYCPICGKPLM